MASELKAYRGNFDTTLSGHVIIARDGEAPYAYTCAGVEQEICTAVNSHEALVQALKELCDAEGGTRGGMWKRARAALRAAGGAE